MRGFKTAMTGVGQAARRIAARLVRTRRGKVVAGGVAAILLAGGGAALATTLDSPSAENSAIISDAAGQLGVSASALQSALIKAIDDEINSEVSAGTISQSQASALESRLASGQVPLFNLVGGGFGRGVGFGVIGVDVNAAESYLGLSASQLRSDLQGGQTLAQIATAQGKTADGLVQALVSAAESRLSSAVAAGKLSSSQVSTIESNLTTMITAIVNGTSPAGGPGHGFLGGGFAGRGGRFGLGGELSSAASYLGLTTAQIRSDVQSGQTLAQIATAQGKTAAGLIQALVSAEQSQLADAVSSGKLSSTQESTIESKLTQRITSLVNGSAHGGFGGFGRGGFGFGFGFGHAGNPGFGGGTGGSTSATTTT